MASGEMKSPSWIAVWCAALSAAFALVSLYFAIVFRFAVGISGSPTLTVDQILGALTLMVGLVGLIVAVAATAIAIIAVFGFGEIRQITTRRTDELLRNIIGSLRRRKEISAFEAQELWQGIQEEDLREFEPESVATPSNKSGGSQAEGRTEPDDRVEQYPSAGKENK